MLFSLRKLFLISCLIVPLSAIGQLELNLGSGGVLYRGDLSLNNLLKDFKNTGFAFQIGLKWQLFDNARIRLHGFSGQIQGDDNKSEDPARALRNLDFFSTVYELSLGADYSFLHSRLQNRNFDLYAIGGLAFFSNNPMTEYNGLTVALPPLRTEGQATPYSITDLAVQIGGGISVHLNNSISINFELIGRLTQNDYLDDVSGEYPDYNTLLQSQGQLSAALSDRRDEFFNAPEGTTDLPGVGENGRRGNANSKDYYSSFMINFVIRLGQSNNGLAKGILCPTI